MPPSTKRCPSCGVVKGASEFYLRKVGTLGSYCKPCHKLNQKANPTPPEIQRARAIKCKFGMTIQQWEEMATSQNWLCAICRDAPIQVTDHCHKSGAVRGLLCQSCNKVLGFAKDNPDVLIAAVAYLEKENTNAR